MTAEVAILNKSAVALAADSKVTIGSGNSEKTYDSVNKIFTLSKRHPVGCMIYGNADFMRFPWETIIKLYRHQKRDRSEPTVDAWARDFQKFLKGFGTIRQVDIRANMASLLVSMFGQIEDHALRLAHVRGVGIPSPEFEAILLDILARRIKQLRGEGPWLSQARATGLVTRYWRVITDIVADFVSGSSNKKLIDESINLAGTALISNYFSPHMSGVVIAGFGEKEIFPAVVPFETDGYVGSSLKISKPKSSKITFENPSSVLAFAQNEIVYRFMEGIDPGYSDYLAGAIETALIDSNLKVFEKWAPTSKRNNKTRAAIRAAAQKHFQTIENSATAYRRREFHSPITGMVAILPKDELANLAESLLTLTTLHRRVSRELETVGLAVISKGDGFIWVKRKHYFRPELNRHWEMNYMRDAGGKR